MHPKTTAGAVALAFFKTLGKFLFWAVAIFALIIRGIFHLSKSY